MKKIVVASDSFKGSLSSMQVADAVERAVLQACPACDVIKIDVADGGEGTMDALQHTLGGQKVCIEVSDPLGRPVRASYVILEDGTTAVVEMAVASGLTLLSPEERNPLETSTYGTGQLIADALNKGCRKFMIGIGGSATNDAGMGMLQALGYRFTDAQGNALCGCGESLEKVASIDASSASPALKESEFIVACDVDAPLYGPKGAAYVFAPQKGADDHMVMELDAGLENMADIIRKVTGKDIRDVPGAGAAGGLGGAFHAFMAAKLQRGAEMILDAIGFDDMIKGADLVITGEGCVDNQTLTGKLPYVVMQHCVKAGIPVAVIGGSVNLDKDCDIPGFDFIVPVTPSDMKLSDAMDPQIAYINVRNAIQKLLKTNLL